jgi:hypothetical protein
MAETFTEGGLNYQYNVAWRGGAGSLATYYAGLFVSATPTTVPASTASGVSNGWTEMTASTGTYSRQAIAASAIAAASSNSGAWVSQWPAVTFTGFTSSSPANGGFIASGSVGSAGSPLAFANFDSGASRSLAASADSLQWTPTVKMTP